MQESCTYGSVRGARGNSRPYRNAATCGSNKREPRMSLRSSGLRRLNRSCRSVAIRVSRRGSSGERDERNAVGGTILSNLQSAVAALEQLDGHTVGDERLSWIADELRTCQTDSSVDEVLSIVLVRSRECPPGKCLTAGNGRPV